MSATVKVMTSKDFHLAVKREDGIDYLMTRFYFTTEEDLFKAMRRIDPTYAEGHIKELKKKRRWIRKRERAGYRRK